MMKKIIEKMKIVTNKVFNETENFVEAGLENGSINAIATGVAVYGVYRNYKKCISYKEDTTWHKFCKLSYGLAAVYSTIMVVANATYAVYDFGKNILHIGSSNNDGVE